jgi:hypothetical protein
VVARRLGAAHVHLGADPRQRLPAGDRHRARRLLPRKGTRQSLVLSFFISLAHSLGRICHCHTRHAHCVAARRVWHKRSLLVWQRLEQLTPLMYVCCSTRCTLTRGAGASSWRALCPSTGCRASLPTCWWWSWKPGCLPTPSCCTFWSPCGCAASCTLLPPHLHALGNKGTLVST